MQLGAKSDQVPSGTTQYHLHIFNLKQEWAIRAGTCNKRERQSEDGPVPYLAQGGDVVVSML